VSREIRFWIGLIIIPAVSMAATIMSTQEVKQAIAKKGINILAKWL